MANYIKNSHKQPRRGYGTLTWSNGDTYEGELSGFDLSGWGIYTSTDIIYEGTHLNNAFTGKGTLTFSSGDSYSGEVVDGVPDGVGVKRLASGEIISGTWKEGKQWGRGRKIMPGAWKYEGEMQLGEFQGQGVYTRASGETLRGTWERGEPVAIGPLELCKEVQCITGDNSRRIT